MKKVLFLNDEFIAKEFTLDYQDYQKGYDVYSDGKFIGYLPDKGDDTIEEFVRLFTNRQIEEVESEDRYRLDDYTILLAYK